MTFFVTVYCAESTADRSHLDDNRSDWTLADISTLLQSKSRLVNNTESDPKNASDWIFANNRIYRVIRLILHFRMMFMTI